MGEYSFIRKDGIQMIESVAIKETGLADCYFCRIYREEYRERWDVENIVFLVLINKFTFSAQCKCNAKILVAITLRLCYSSWKSYRSDHSIVVAGYSWDSVNKYHLIKVFDDNLVSDFSSLLWYNVSVQGLNVIAKEFITPEDM